ncbi:hypothetical protein FBUS_11339 [Fasciolopsis buskii]|uniref:Uncharacterized protein n=1 Tax=Fasciolopsis buskii TaxID=27845 RepID=A0A8E0VNY9_9TREM|nr:hypothetical protein FBUS_11339 [Fasciolopsis buski]
MPDSGSDWTTALGDPGSVDFKPQSAAVNEKLQTLRTDLLVGTAAFTDRVPGQDREASLPWDIADPQEANYESQLEHTVWDSRNLGAPLASISAGLKSSIDPRDIFVDALHNFHPNYRHYTQVRRDRLFFLFRMYFTNNDLQLSLYLLRCFICNQIHIHIASEPAVP